MLSFLTPEIQQQIDNLPFNKEKARKDITGQKFEYLTVLGRGKNYISPKGKKESQWWCICDCPQHNIILVKITNLTSGNTKSCGCLNKQKATERIVQVGKNCAKDLRGQTFGELIALMPTEKRNNNSVVWECKCSCGKIHYVSAHDLINHRVESCGCQNDSRGIRKIKKILQDNNIPFFTEQTFSTCRFPDTQNLARFDFFINNSFLLEFDGIQHFKECDSNFFKDSLKTRQEHDLYKNNWCKQNNIVLKRIPYTEENNLSIELIMGDKFIIN